MGLIKVTVITLNLVGLSMQCVTFLLIRHATISASDLASPVQVHSRDEIGQLMQALSDMKDSLAKVVSSVQQVSQLISQVNLSLSEQATGIRQIDQAMGQLDQTTQQNAALAEESAAAVDSVRQETTALVSTVGQFRLRA